MGTILQRFGSKESRILPSFSNCMFAGDFNRADLYTGLVFRVIV